MNMNKALQNLYHAVSNETTTKVNISKLLVDIHYAITGKESANKNNWSKIVNSMADNWPEGAGGSSSDFSTATMTIVNHKSEVINFAIPSVFEENAMGEASPACIYTLSNIPANESMSTTVPLYKGKILIDNPFSQDVQMSGSVELILGNAMFSITGDCTINILDIF